MTTSAKLSSFCPPLPLSLFHATYQYLATWSSVRTYFRRTRWNALNIPSLYDEAHCYRHRCRRRIILPPCKFTDNISVASHSLTRVIYVVRNGTLASRGALICGSIRTPEPPLLNNGAPILPSHCPRVHPLITNTVRVS